MNHTQNLDLCYKIIFYRLEKFSSIIKLYNAIIINIIILKYSLMINNYLILCFGTVKFESLIAKIGKTRAIVLKS